VRVTERSVNVMSGPRWDFAMHFMHCATHAMHFVHD
jgi:hypothetical protein